MATYGLFGRSPATARRAGAAAAAASATSAGPSASSAAESLHQRSLFVHVRPPPASLSERRSVLRVLERYGKTEMFKKMTGNGAFIAIASSAAMASTLVQRSPLQYEFVAETFRAVQPWGTPGAPRLATPIQPIETTTTAPPPPLSGTAAQTVLAKTEAQMHALADAQEQITAPPPPRRQTDLVAHKAFVVSVFPSEGYHHQTVVRQGPLHGPWPRDDDVAAAAAEGVAAAGDTTTGAAATGRAGDKDTFVYNALKAVVPTGASSEALCDWRVRVVGGVGGGGGGGGSGSSHDGNGDPNKNTAADHGSERRTRGSFLSTLAHIKARKARRALANKSPLASMVRATSGRGGSAAEQANPETGERSRNMARDKPNR